MGLRLSSKDGGRLSPAIGFLPPGSRLPDLRKEAGRNRSIRGRGGRDHSTSLFSKR